MAAKALPSLLPKTALSHTGFNLMTSPASSMTYSTLSSTHKKVYGHKRHSHLYINKVKLILDKKRKRGDVRAKLGIAVNNHNFGHGRPKVDLGLVANFAAFVDESLHALHPQLQEESMRTTI